MRLERDKDYLVCEHCRSNFFPQPDADGVVDLDEPSETGCPVCRAAMVHAAAANIRVLFCRECRGLLVGMDDFVSLVGELRSRNAEYLEQPRALDPGELERAVSCPRCRRRMHTHPYAGPGNIVIDNCPVCRLNWLDYRELRRVARSPGSWA
jgi:Zn-finger nucleic acid-binding protein